MTDYTGARFWAISGLGYGKGFSEEEAKENYVQIQLRNWTRMGYSGPSKDLEDALRNGELRPVTFKSPEGVDGFISDGSVYWTTEGSDELPVKATDADVLNNPFWK